MIRRLSGAAVALVILLRILAVLDSLSRNSDPQGPGRPDLPPVQETAGPALATTAPEDPYFSVDWAIVWETARQDIPRLLELVRPILAELSPDHQE